MPVSAMMWGDKQVESVYVLGVKGSHDLLEFMALKISQEQQPVVFTEGKAKVIGSSAQRSVGTNRTPRKFLQAWQRLRDFSHPTARFVAVFSFLFSKVVSKSPTFFYTFVYSPKVWILLYCRIEVVDSLSDHPKGRLITDRARRPQYVEEGSGKPESVALTECPVLEVEGALVNARQQS